MLRQATYRSEMDLVEYNKLENWKMHAQSKGYSSYPTTVNCCLVKIWAQQGQTPNFSAPEIYYKISQFLYAGITQHFCKSNKVSILLVIRYFWKLKKIIFE